MTDIMTYFDVFCFVFVTIIIIAVAALGPTSKSFGPVRTTVEATLGAKLAGAKLAVAMREFSAITSAAATAVAAPAKEESGPPGPPLLDLVQLAKGKRVLARVLANGSALSVEQLNIIVPHILEHIVVYCISRFDDPVRNKNYSSSVTLSLSCSFSLSLLHSSCFQFSSCTSCRLIETSMQKLPPRLPRYSPCARRHSQRSSLVSRASTLRAWSMASSFLRCCFKYVLTINHTKRRVAIHARTHTLTNLSLSLSLSLSSFSTLRRKLFSRRCSKLASARRR